MILHLIMAPKKRRTKRKKGKSPLKSKTPTKITSKSHSTRQSPKSRHSAKSDQPKSASQVSNFYDETKARLDFDDSGRISIAQSWLDKCLPAESLERQVLQCFLEYCTHDGKYNMATDIYDVATGRVSARTSVVISEIMNENPELSSDQPHELASGFEIPKYAKERLEIFYLSIKAYLLVPGTLVFF